MTKHKLFFVGLCLALLVVLVIPVAGQDIGPGEGAPVINPNFGGDIATLNPIISEDGPSNDIIDLIFPEFLEVDIETAQLAPGAAGSLATDWTISDDGLVYTFTLRDDWFWDDGTQVTSADIQYVWDAIQVEEVETNGNLLDALDKIANVESPDAQTVVITFKEAACNAVDVAATLQPVPSHVYMDLFGDDYAAMNDSEANLDPAVSGGRFSFLNFRPGEQVTLVANQDYPDAAVGAVIPEGFIDKVVTDQTVQTEQFLAGELSYMSVPQSRQDELQALVDSGEYQGAETLRYNIRFISFNMADPENPQSGLDEDGNPIDQGIHPVFGDVRVRQALDFAIDFEAINEGVFFGYGLPAGTHTGATNWVDVSDIEARPFDQEQAAALLEEAGWVDTDGDGIRECQGCLYAQEVNPDFEGEPLSFELLTNAGNVSQEALGNVLVDLWGEVGADVEFAAIDFNALLDVFTGQTYDSAMIFWGFGFPEDPDGIRVTFGPENDEPGGGFNTGSYNNPQLNELLDTALTLPGCDPAERAALYHEAYQILHDEVPWIWVGGSTGLVVAQNNVENFERRETHSMPSFWNVESWSIAP